MRILHVVQELAVGGAERVLVALVRAADEAGHESAVVAAPGPLATEIGVPVYPLPLVRRRLRRLPATACAVADAVRAERPDLVHAHNPTMGLAVGMATARGLRLPGLTSVQGVPERDDRATAVTLKIAGLPVVACGPAIADALQLHGLSPAAVIPNAVPPPPPRADPRAIRAEWGLDPASTLVISVGRLVPVKNHELALAAVARLPETSLAIVGGGPEEEALRARAVSEGVADRVIFAGPRPDAWSLMGAADVAILTSRGEGLPLTVLEALAIGTPVVATRVRGVVELVEDEQSALLVPDDDPVALAGALRRLLEDHALGERLARAGRVVAARFGERRMTAAYLDLYARLGRRRV
jgi:glycosyltransferase involved in cell wall biosynthesis